MGRASREARCRLRPISNRPSGALRVRAPAARPGQETEHQPRPAPPPLPELLRRLGQPRHPGIRRCRHSRLERFRRYRRLRPERRPGRHLWTRRLRPVIHRCPHLRSSRRLRCRCCPLHRSCRDRRRPEQARSGELPTSSVSRRSLGQCPEPPGSRAEPASPPRPHWRVQQSRTPQPASTAYAAPLKITPDQRAGRISVRPDASMKAARRRFAAS
jgi:hypothetical protein